MKEIKFIKKSYKPIQPAVKPENTEIIYQEAQPNKEIENLVYCFWQLKTSQIIKEPFVYRVVSDGCIDIFFNHSQPTNCFLMGFYRKFTKFSIGNKFDYIGIRFLPSTFPLLFGINAKEISNQSQELKQVLPNFAQWIYSTINPRQAFGEIIELFNKKLNEFCHNQCFDFDVRFFNSLANVV